MKASGFLLLWMLLACVVAHVCRHDEVRLTSALMSTPLIYTDSYPFPNNTQQIRLRIDTSYLDNDELGMTCTYTGQVVPGLSSSSSTTTTPYTCKAGDVMTATMRSYLGNLLDEAHDLFTNTLNVMPVQGSFTLVGSSSPQGLYGGVYLANEYTNGDINYLDMVIFVTARPIIQNGNSITSTLAVAKVVQEDQNRRPVFGHLNLNLVGINTDTGSLPRNFGVVIHEMTHSFGFNSQKFTNINALPGQPSDITATAFLTVGANDLPSSRTIITSTRVVAWAQNYFGCPNIQGVELENQGGSGTALSHWEKRLVFNEYMTGTASRNPVFSELTLSLLEDTGWYVVNYSLAGQLLWGQAMGCDFSNRGCNNWPAYNGYFCSSDGSKGCTADYQAKGECQISSAASTVPAIYQYFPDDPSKIGSYDLPDYCPITWGYDNGWCFDTSQSSSSLLDHGEVFGKDSKCFTSTLLKDLAVGGSSSSVCYQTYCTGPQQLRVKIGAYWYLCPPESDIKVIGFGGVLSCPERIQQICANSVEDDTWPIFSIITPNSGGPGLHVTITGLNFAIASKVNVGGDLDNVTVLSSTVITGIIPNTDTYKNPANILDRQISVIITDAKGRTAVGYNKFTIVVKLDKSFFINAIHFMGDNWLITTAIIAGIVVTCSICGYCIYRQKGIPEEADTDFVA